MDKATSNLSLGVSKFGTLHCDLNNQSLNFNQFK